MSDEKQPPKVAVLLADITLIGTLGGAMFANWDKIFPPKQDTTSRTSPSVLPSSPTQSPSQIPSPSETFITSQKIEAENGEIADGGYRVNDESAELASNNAYVNLGDRSNSKSPEVKFVTSNLEAGQYRLEIHYTKYVNNTPEYREPDYQNLYINDEPNPIQIKYVKTYGDEPPRIPKWSDNLDTVVRLQRGINTIKIKNNNPNFPGTVSIDYIFISRIGA